MLRVFTVSGEETAESARAASVTGEEEVESAKIIESSAELVTAVSESSKHEEENEDDDKKRGDDWRSDTRQGFSAIFIHKRSSGTWDDEGRWMFLMFRRMMHRKERAGDEAVDGTTGGGGTGGAGFSGVSSSGGSGGGVETPGNGSSSNSGSKNSNNNSGGNMENMSEVDQFGYPDSPTQSWLAQNADLSPLRILDNINLKSEFPYTISMDTEKPPDISNISMDHNTTNLLQFAASVPVPDHTGTFLDIGLDTFQSLYEDQLIGELVSTGGVTSTTVTSSDQFTKLAEITPTQVTDLRSLGIQNIQCIQLPDNMTTTTIAATPAPTAFKSLAPPQPPALKALVEPLPASALQGLIKVEPYIDTSLVKQEDGSSNDGMDSFDSDGMTSPSSAGGKMKTSNRKKSTASTDTEDDDLSNIPSLQMRLQIIQQRVSFIFLINI